MIKGKKFLKALLLVLLPTGIWLTSSFDSISDEDYTWWKTIREDGSIVLNNNKINLDNPEETAYNKIRNKIGIKPLKLYDKPQEMGFKTFEIFWMKWLFLHME